MQILSSAGAWALLGVAVILALYMLKRQYEEHIVPSTFLWQRAMADQSANRPIQRLRRNILMFLQLLIALLIALALMHPATKGLAGGDYVFIFDVSASMRAEDRMDQAQKQALGWLDAMPEGSSVTLITAGDSVQTLLARTEDLIQARQVVRGIQPGYTTADLAQAVSLGRAMAQEIEGLQIVVFSDEYIASGGIHGVNAESGADNRAILSVNLAAREDRTDAVARVANYGTDAEITMEFYIDDELWDIYSIELAAGEIGSVSVSLPAGTRKVRGAIVQTDAIAEDNEMYGVVEESNTHVLAFAGQENVFVETALALRADISLIRTGLEDLEDSGAEIYVVSDGATLTFNHAGTTSTITVGTEQAAQGALTVTSDAERWFENVTLDGVVIKTIRPLMGGTPLLHAGEDVLIAADDAGIVFGFDVHDSNLPLKAGFPVLIQNILTEMLPELAVQVKDCRCGDLIDLQTSARVTEAWIQTPDGQRLEMPCRAELPGVYTLMQRMEDGEETASEFVVRMPAQESDVRQVAPSAEGMGADAMRMAGRDWALLLAAFALLISILEWWVSKRGY